MLFDSTRIGGIDVSCRVIRSATFEGMADTDGHPTEQLFDQYGALAEGGTGLIITGMIASSSMEPHQPFQIRLDRDSDRAPLKKLTDFVHTKGGKVMAQIVIMGSSILWPEGDGHIISPSGVPELTVGQKESQSLTIAEIQQLIADSAAAARRARQAGFDGVQFHGAHGYLASKFLTPYYNRRTDKFGGTLENRARFLLEAIKAIRQAVGADYPVWVKFNCADFMKEPGLTFEESKQVMAWLAQAGVNAIEVSGGNTSSIPRQGVIRPIRRTKEPMYFSKYAAEAAQLLPDIDIGVVGGFRTVEQIETCLRDTKIAFISLCRPLLRQPDLLKLWKDGSTEPALCISCSRCFGDKDADCIFNRRARGEEE